MANSLKMEKHEFEKKREEENFMKACLDGYEDLMDEHFRSAQTPAEFERWHQKKKSAIISKLPETWKNKMGAKPMPADISFNVTQKIDASFVQLSKHFEQSKLREQSRGKEQQSKESAVKLYNDEMDKFLTTNKSAKLKDVIIAHTVASMAAMRNVKDVHKVSAATVTELKSEIDKCFQVFKTRTKMPEKNSQDPAIGIDLGTTNCCVMVYSNGEVNTVPNQLQGNANTTPSYVMYLQDGTDKFGHEAKENAYQHPETTIYDAKRMIGRPWTDEKLQEDRKHWPFEVVDDHKQPKINTWGQPRYPHEVSARLLAQLRFMADEYLGLPLGSVTKVVITVPAYFTEPQRRATAEAAEIAGLEVLSILSEPTAAAIAYSWGRRVRDQKRKVLIYDLGGGTFDVSIAVVESDNVDILAVDGDTHLGGQDVDQLLMNYCIEEFKNKEKVDLLQEKESPLKTVRDGAAGALSRLKLQCEKAKEKLSTTQKTTVNVDSITNGKNLSVVVTRDKVDELVKPLIENTLKIVDRAIEMTSLKGVKDKTEIDDVILVGGSTRLPLVSKMLSQHFNGKRLGKHINPDEAVAYGAAIQAAILNQSEGMRNVKVQDVTPLTLGIKTVPDIFSGIIQRNTKIPCEYSKVYGTNSDNHTGMSIRILQGENKTASQNKQVGKFKLTGLPPKPAGEEKATVTMKIDANGLLHVEAVSVTMGHKESISITSDRLAVDKITICKLTSEITRSALVHAEVSSDM